MAGTGLQEFKKVVGNFRDLSSLAIKGTVAAPAVNLWARLGPPPTVAVSALTSVAAFLSVVWTFHFWFAMARKKLDTRMRYCLITFGIALAASGILLERFTVQPLHRDRVVIGFSILPGVKDLISDNFTEIEALEGASYHSDRVWTSASIAVVQTAIVGLWVITFVSLSLFLSAFIIVQRRKTST